MRGRSPSPLPPFGISGPHFARLKRNKRRRRPFVTSTQRVTARTSGQPIWEFMSRISFLPDFLPAGCNVRGVFTWGRVLLTSARISRGGLAERRRGRGRETGGNVRRARGGRGTRGERVNTRRSAMVIMKAPTKLETLHRFLFLLASRTWAASSRRVYP